ncbi:hypothetical protein F4776DRAFT_656284 [Hypoxylon sp. NC0597]|nr:hypothetical protein F4776DRAFT_656284 [Hypoxylon sp. NC0597]
MPRKFPRRAFSTAYMFRFWKNMFKLIEGLTLIQSFGGADEESATAFRGSHQDIKLGNILFTCNEPSNKYDVVLTSGDQWYSAPECVANYEALYRFDNRVGSEVDIWSLGCVLSEAAVWTVCGQPGLRDYLERRFQETRQFESMARSGFAGCFHNGNEPLSAVTLMHVYILNSKRHWDTITPEIIRLIHKSILLEPTGPRKKAEEKALEGNFMQRENLLSTPPIPALFPSRITMEEVQQYRNDMKKHRPPNEYVATQYRLLQEKIKGRDQIFLIDDSTSMTTRYRDDVMKTIIALSYLAKKIDEDGLDLKLLGEVQQHFIRNPSSGTSSMEASMSMMVDYIIGKLPNPYVTFTGLPGVPRRSAFISGVEKEIERLITNVRARNLGRTSVTIPFIRFGDDLESIDQLNYLDNFGKHIDWDIVDTKSHRDHVPDMFIGSIDDVVDDKEES